METDEATDEKYVAVTLAKKTMGFNSWEALLEAERADAAVTDRAFLQVAIGGEVVGKVGILV